MPTGTKILIALIVAIFGSVVIYYATVAPPAPGPQRSTDGSVAAPPGGTASPAPVRPTPVTPAPVRTPTPSPANPTGAAGSGVTPPSGGGLGSGAAPTPAGPQPSVSDPLTNTLRDPVRPVVDPNAPVQSGGKGDAPAPSTPSANPSAAPSTPQGTNPNQPGAQTPTSPPSGSASPSGAPSGPAPAAPVKPTTPPSSPTPSPAPSPGNGPTPALPNNPNRPTGAPTSGPTAGSSTRQGEHIVANGETMSSIAEKHYGDRNKWQLIAKANPLVDPANMKIGMKLTIPPAPAKSTTAPAPTGPTGPTTPTPAGPTTGAGESTHTVAAGDTLISLSRSYYGKDGLWELIYDANRALIGDDPAALKVGMKLRIPKKPS